MLSLISFTATRTIGAQSVGDLPVPDIAAPERCRRLVLRRGREGREAGSAARASGRGRPARPSADALADGKVVVLLFAEKDAADDQATARHFATLSQLGSGVKTFRAGIADVGRYAGIVAKLGITQAPSIVIVRPDLRAVPADRGLRRVAVPASARQGPAAVSDDRPHLRPVPAPGVVNEAVARETPLPDEQHTGLIPPTQARRWRALHLRRDRRARLRLRRARARRGRGGEVRRADARGDPRRRRRPDRRAARPCDRRALRARLRRPFDLQDRPGGAQPGERAGCQALQRGPDRLRRDRQAADGRDGRPVERARARRPEAHDRARDHARGRRAGRPRQP